MRKSQIDTIFTPELFKETNIFFFMKIVTFETPELILINLAKVLSGENFEVKPKKKKKKK